MLGKCLDWISIHALTRSATGWWNGRCGWSVRFQSTHSRGVRLWKCWARLDYDSISIHALTRSATFCLENIMCSYVNFNPRTHEECDLSKLITRRSTGISIHALTRSATILTWLFFLSAHISIHALTRSATLIATIRLINPTFQSTHSRGVRLFHPFLNRGVSQFQSTHSRGVRHDRIFPDTHFAVISIHALTRSATNCFWVLFDYWKFQSTHSRGVRHGVPF